MKHIISIIILLASSIVSFCQNTAQTNWERLGPGGGGATFLPSFPYYNPDNFFIRCDMTGSYLTTDGGNSYKQINFDNGASSYAFDLQDSNKIYIGSAVLNRSLDGGKTWQQLFPKKARWNIKIALKNYFFR